MTRRSWILCGCRKDIIIAQTSRSGMILCGHRRKEDFAEVGGQAEFGGRRNYDGMQK